jgi:hypothetical protein
MDVTRESLAEKFKLYNDDELLRLYRSRDLTALASAVAQAELASRGINVVRPAATAAPSAAAEPVDAPEPVSEGDLVAVAQLFDPTEAEMLRGRLEAEGVPAMVADTQTAQVNPLYRLAIGGVRVMVPEAHLDRAREVVRADARGEYALDDNVETGAPPEPGGAPYRQHATLWAKVGAVALLGVDGLVIGGIIALCERARRWLRKPAAP